MNERFLCFMPLMLVLPAVTLSGCAHDGETRLEPVLAPVDVAVPVSVGCVPPNIAAAPEYPDTDTALKTAGDAAARYQLLYAGRKVRSARLNELEPIVAGCPKGAPK